MTVGTGFIALALTMVGGWNPYRILLASVLFGLLRSLGNGLQILGIDVRTEFITMLPYIGIMVALALLAGTHVAPGGPRDPVCPRPPLTDAWISRDEGGGTRQR